MLTPTTPHQPQDWESLVRQVADLPPKQLVVELRAHLCERWHRGERIPAEEYLTRFPKIDASVEVAVDLIYAEFLERDKSGDRPRPEEYAERFPRFADAIRRQFAVHAALASEAGRLEGDAAADKSDSSLAAGVQRDAHSDAAREAPRAAESTCIAPRRASPSAGFAAAGDAASQLAPSTMPPRVGRFDIRGRLGAGGFATVYRAIDPQLGREVALKVPHPHLLSVEHRERFMREARAAAQLQHPHLVSVYDSGDTPDGCYIAYQLVEGQTLAKRIADLPSGRLAPRDAGALARKLASAVHHAHSKGVFHRDLKTSNILIDADGEPHVSDFGLVRLEGDATLTATAAILGTPAYMSPEQAEGSSHAADARSDVYSLGVILYELVAGRLPFVGSPQSVLRAVIEREPARLRSLDRAVPLDLETICLKAMAKRPAERYASAEHLAEDLGRWLAGEPILARPATSLERAVKWARRHPAGAGLIATAAAAVVAFVVFGIVYNVRLETANRRTRAMLARSQASQGVQLLEAGDARGLLYLLDACGSAEPDSEALASYRRVWASWHAAWAGRLHAIVGHEQQSLTAAISPSGRLLATGSGDGLFRMWDVASGQPLYEPLRFTDPHLGPQHFAFSPDEQMVAIANLGDGVHFLDPLTGRPLAPGRIPLHGSMRLAFSSDGRRLVFKVEQGVQLLDTRDWQQVLADGVDGFPSFSPDGRWLVTWHLGLNESGVAVYDAETGRRVEQKLVRHRARIRAVAFSPDSSRLATASDDETARIWDLQTGEPLCDPLKHDDDVWAVTFSPDDRILASASFDGTARLWDAESGRPLGAPLRHNAGVTSVAFSPDRAKPLLATGSIDRTVRLWNPATGEPIGPPLQHASSVRAVSFTPNGQRLLAVPTDGTARIWNVSEPEAELHRLEHVGRVWSVAFDPAGTRLVTGIATEADPDYGAAYVWDARDGSRLFGPLDHGAHVLDVAVSPAGDRFVSVSKESQARVWSLETGEVLDSVPAIPLKVGGLRSVAFHPNGRLIAVGQDSSEPGGGSGCWMIDLESRDIHAKPIRHEAATNDVAFSPDGRLLATAVADRTVRLWDVATGDPVGAPLRHAANVDKIAFSPDGRLLVAASSDLGAFFWDARTWQPLGVRLQQHVHVEDVTFSRDSKLLATAASNGTIRVWDVDSGLPCGPPQRHGGFASSIAFSPDGSTIASGSFDKSARLSRLPWTGDESLRGRTDLKHMTERTWLTIGAKFGPTGDIEGIHWTEWQRLRE